MRPSLDRDLARRLPLRVLLADDNPINQKVGLSVLHKLGYRADIASNGLEVLKALEQKAYDILFLDVQMPEMDGFEAPARSASAGRRQASAHHCHDRQRAHGRPREMSAGGHGRLHLQARPRWRIAVRAGTLGSHQSPEKPTRSFCRALNPPRPTTCSTTAIIAELRNMPPADGVSMLQELVDLFLEGAPPRIAQISQSINDGPMLAFHAHALKSMALNLGAKRIVELSQKLEDLGRARNVHGAPAVLRELESAFTQTKTQLLTLRGQ